MSLGRKVNPYWKGVEGVQVPMTHPNTKNQLLHIFGDLWIQQEDHETIESTLWVHSLRE